MENRHHRRIRDKAIEDAAEGLSPKRDWMQPLGIGAAVVVMGLFVWFFVSRVMPDPNKTRDVKAGGRPLVDTAAGELSISAVENIAVKFMKAETVEELLELVEKPEENEALLRGFLESSGKSLPFNGSILKIADSTYREAPVYEVLISGVFMMPSGLPVVAGVDGEARIIWNLAAGYMDPSWDEVMAEKPEEPVLMKVFVQPDDYYNYEYADDGKWQSIRLSDPVGQKTAYAFVDRSHPRLGFLLKSTLFVPMTIEVKFMPGQQRELLEILDAKVLGWIFEEGT